MLSIMVKRRLLILTSLLFLAAGLASAQSAEQLYAGGRQAFTDELWPTSVSQFSRFLREFPDDPRADSAAYMGAVASFNSGDFRKCIEDLSAFPTRYPDSAWNRRVAYWEGLAHYESGNWSRAERAFLRQAAVRQETAYREQSLLYIGACREQLGHLDGAEDSYRELIGESGSYDVSARATYRLGQVLLTNGKPSQALEIFRRMAFDYSSSPLSIDTDYWMAECYRRIGDEDEALEGYRNFLATVYDSPYRTYALLEAARLASRSGLDDEALAYLDLRDEERRPGDDEGASAALRIRARSYLRIGRLEDARSAYAKILAEPLDDQDSQAAAFNLAQTWIGTSNPGNAVPYLLMAADGPVRRIASDAMYTAGTLMAASGDIKASEVLSDFAGDFPTDSRREEALRLAVKVLKDHERSDESVGILTTLIRDYPDSGEAASYLFMRAEIALERGDTTSALMDYDRLTEVHSDSPLAVDAHSRIGFVYAGRGEHIRAADHFSRAANMAGGARGGESGRRALYSAAVAFMNGGDPDQAAKLFASLTDTDPSGPWGVEAAYHLGEALYESGDYSGSRTAYEKAARYGDSSWAFEAAYAIGWTWFRESDWENAAKAFERAADIAPDKEGRARSLYRIGLSRASESAWNQALDFYGQALDIGRGTWREEALYQKAWAQLNLGLLDDSNVTAGILSREFPDSSLPADLPFRMGEDAMADQRYSDALEWYDRCISGYPESDIAIRAALRGALAAGNSGDAAEAARRYGLWVTAHPGDPGAPAAAHSWADALRDVGDPGAAKDALTELQELSEDRTDLIAPISLAWARLAGVPPESGAILELIAEDESLAAPDRAEALLLRAHLYRNQGDAPRARQVYEVLIRDVPGQVGAEAQEGLAETLSIEGRIDEAAEAYLAVPYLFPDETEIGARSLRKAEKLYREAGREEEADILRSRIDGDQ
jgi:TolA-binding protein